MEWLEALVLGIVQGVTEFLPVSSDGHLAITQQLFAYFTGKPHSGKENLFFDVMLHLGTLAAILVFYRGVVKTGVHGLLGATEVAPAYRRDGLVRTGLLAGVATTPLIPLALFLKKWIEAAFESTVATGFGFLITAAVLLLTAFLRNRGETGKGPLETTWLDALLIGIAQMFAPLPGVSRSGLTVAAGLSLGLSRAWAVGFSLLIAVPAILGATILEVRKVDPASLSGDRVAQTATAAVLAGLVGYGAILWLVKVVRSGRMWYFSVYLIILGLLVLTAALYSKGTGDALRQDAIHRARRGGNPGPVAERPRGRSGGALAGPRRTRTQPGEVDPLSALGAPAVETGRPGVDLGRPLAGRSRES